MKGFVLMVAAGVAAIMGVLIGVVPVQVYDQGELIACGPAVLGGDSRFADLACATVYQSVQTLSVMLLVGAAIMIVFGAAALRADPARAVSAAQHVSAT